MYKLVARKAYYLSWLLPFSVALGSTAFSQDQKMPEQRPIVDSRKPGLYQTPIVSGSSGSGAADQNKPVAPASSDDPNGSNDQGSPGGQTNPTAKDNANAGSQIHSFLIDVLRDQKTIYTSPAHVKKKDLEFLLPVGALAAAMFATDRRVGQEINETPPNSLTRASYHFGQAVGYPTAIGLVGGMFGVAALTHRTHLAETGKLTGEALIDSTILIEVMKLIARRERPTNGGPLVPIDNTKGSFEVGGSSFPSGHAVQAWTVAAVLAERYPDRPFVGYTAYGLAALISVSRVSARQHFPSDVLFGSVIGYMMGHYIGRTHSPRPHPMPLVSPVVNHATRTYGMSVGLQF